MNERLHKIALMILPLLCAWIIRIWFATCKMNIHGLQQRETAEALKKPIIGTIWHYSIIGQFYAMRNEDTGALVSASKDGEYIARLAEHFGFITVRGSRNRGGISALKGLLRLVRAGNNVGIVADGSQGPARVVQAGAILLASKTGSPILPMAWSASRYFSVKSWDRTVLPKLFSRIEFFYGEPLEVPEKMESSTTEEYRLLLEQRLNSLYEEAWKIQGKSEH
jgi:lysophospholipid acyltransferase (LPLAT)-like uncharacterized protein